MLRIIGLLMTNKLMDRQMTAPTKNQVWIPNHSAVGPAIANPTGAMMPLKLAERANILPCISGSMISWRRARDGPLAKGMALPTTNMAIYNPMMPVEGSRPMINMAKPNRKMPIMVDFMRCLKPPQVLSSIPPNNIPTPRATCPYESSNAPAPKYCRTSRGCKANAGLATKLIITIMMVKAKSERQFSK